MLSNDIFDAEMGSSDSEHDDLQEANESNACKRDSDNESEEDDTQISAALKRRLSKVNRTAQNKLCIMIASTFIYSFLRAAQLYTTCIIY